MSNEKHAPGPWLVEGQGIVFIIKGENEYRAEKTTRISCPVGKIEILDETNESEQANARLIASSPELLAALEACSRYANFDGSEEILHMARSAIRKARGE